jgi:hypothetical protein
MTEAEWLAETDAVSILSLVESSKKNDRRLRLLRVACCRSIWKDITIKPARQAVLAAECYADKSISPQELELAYRRGCAAFLGYTSDRNLKRRGRQPEVFRRMYSVAFAVDTATPGLSYPTPEYPLDEKQYRKLILIPSLLRDIFGNPFCPITFDSAWLTSTVSAVAKQMYDSRDFSAMPILADALQDAGCDNDDILNHCRDPKATTHVRGCWVVDLVLGKS